MALGDDMLDALRRSFELARENNPFPAAVEYQRARNTAKFTLLMAEALLSIMMKSVLISLYRPGQQAAAIRKIQRRAALSTLATPSSYARNAQQLYCNNTIKSG
jgi:hypothetical protein